MPLRGSDSTWRPFLLWASLLGPRDAFVEPRLAGQLAVLDCAPHGGGTPMNTRMKVAVALVAFVVCLSGCSATKKGMTDMGMTTPQLTKDLASGLGITEAQAT